MEKLLAIILSFVILVTSMGFTISSHICGGKKVKTVMGMIHSDVSCGMEEDNNSNSCEKGVMIASNCCQDEFQLVQFDEDCTQQANEVKLNKELSAVLITVVLNLVSLETTQEVFYSDYSPPPLVRDVPVLIQSFLI
ncbi:MAG: hypothetical protein J5I47_01830 [Vicingus serpentipes]|nr:hypothetical protein [Vicingus serpentipes]